MPGNLLRCDLQDYFEAACVKRYELSLKLSDGQNQTGTAQDLRTRDQREFLVLSTKAGEVEIDLTEIRKAVVLTRPTTFTDIPL